MSLKLKEERVEGGGPELLRSGRWCLVESEGHSQLEKKEGGYLFIYLPETLTNECTFKHLEEEKH